MVDVEFDGLKLIAGEPVLDFVNSVKFRGRAQPGERLKTFHDLCRWCCTAGLLSGEEFESVAAFRAETVFAEALAVRETLRKYLDNPGDSAACNALESLLADARPTLRLSPEAKRLFYRVEVRRANDVLRRLKSEIASFLETWEPEKTRSCLADDCDWVFLDRTKAGARRWCDSRTCGNRDRVRRYRAH